MTIFDMIWNKSQVIVKATVAAINSFTFAEKDASIFLQSLDQTLIYQVLD